jgi:hypothetical protein
MEHYFLGNASSFPCKPHLPLFSACAPTTRRGLSRTPATKTESSFVLLFFAFALSKASFFFSRDFFKKFSVLQRVLLLLLRSLLLSFYFIF